MAVGGVMTSCPVFNKKISAWFRGMKIGFLISLPMALGTFLVNGNAEVINQSFWYIIISGGVIGMIIDLIITKLTGEGKELFQ